MEDKKRGATTKKTPTEDNNSINNNRQSINKETETIKGGDFGALGFGQAHLTTKESPAEMKGDTGVTALTREQDFKAVGTLSKMPLSLMKTASRITGRDIGQRSFFKNPYYDENPTPQVEKLPQNTMMVAQELILSWQTRKDKGGAYVIKSLNEMAEKLGMTPQKLKIHLVKLGGFFIPFAQRVEVKRGGKTKGAIEFGNDRPFDIRFIVLDEEDTRDSERIGTRYSSYPKGAYTYQVKVILSPPLQQALEGAGLGYVLASEGFIPFVKDLSEMAYKIFNFSGSNTPKRGRQGIRFEVLIKQENLDLESRVAKRGKGNVIREIQIALEELKNGGHITKWEYIKEKDDLFKWSYSDFIIKHKEFIREKQLVSGDKKAEDFVDFNDETIPKEKRKNAYVKWATKKGTSKKKVQNIARKKFKN